MLRSVDVNDIPACGFLVCTFLACRFQAGHLKFICHEDSVRFSTLKIDGWVCDAFRACISIAAACGAEQWVCNIFMPQLHTLQTMKSWAGPGNKARYQQLNVESNSEHNQHLSSTLSNSHYFSVHSQARVRPQLLTPHTRYEFLVHNIRMEIWIPSTQYSIHIQSQHDYSNIPWSLLSSSVTCSSLSLALRFTLSSSVCMLSLGCI